MPRRLCCLLGGVLLLAALAAAGRRGKSSKSSSSSSSSSSENETPATPAPVNIPATPVPTIKEETAAPLSTPATPAPSTTPATPAPVAGPCADEALLPGSQFLLYGYNLVQGTPVQIDPTESVFDPGFVRRHVVDPGTGEGRCDADGRFLIHDQVESADGSGGCSLYNRAGEITGDTSLAAELSAFYDLSDSGLPWEQEHSFAGSTSFQQFHDATYSESTRAVWMLRLLECLPYRLTLGPDWQVSDGFAQAVEGLNSTDNVALTAFLDTWGTHFISAVELGAQFGYAYQLNEIGYAESQYELWDLGGKATAGFLVNQVGLPAGSGYSQQDADDFASVVASVSLFSRGPSLPPGDSLTDVLHQWNNEMLTGDHASLAPLRLTLAPISDALSTVHFPEVTDAAALAQKQADLAAALADYCSGGACVAYEPDIVPFAIIPQHVPGGQEAICGPGLVAMSCTGSSASPFALHPDRDAKDAQRCVCDSDELGGGSCQAACVSRDLVPSLHIRSVLSSGGFTVECEGNEEVAVGCGVEGQVLTTFSLPRVASYRQPGFQDDACFCLGQQTTCYSKCVDIATVPEFEYLEVKQLGPGTLQAECPFSAVTKARMFLLVCGYRMTFATDFTFDDGESVFEVDRTGLHSCQLVGHSEHITSLDLHIACGVIRTDTDGGAAPRRRMV